VVPKQKSKNPAGAVFQIGEKVRVRQGVRDSDYPDMPLGGWKGKVVEVHKDGIYTVQWNKETLSSIHPVFKQRCEIDGLDEERYGLGGDDLEPDTGGPLNIEQPEKITTKKLSPRDQDDRIRMVFGLTSNDLLPDVNSESLEAYHDHLSSNLVFPFTAHFRPRYGRLEQVKVIGLGDPDDEAMIDEDYGILCEARCERRIMNPPLGELEQVKGKPNRPLVDDYCYWFHNWR
jgi:hypothetical protein